MSTDNEFIEYNDKITEEQSKIVGRIKMMYVEVFEIRKLNLSLKQGDSFTESACKYPEQVSNVLFTDIISNISLEYNSNFKVMHRILFIDERMSEFGKSTFAGQCLIERKIKHDLENTSITLQFKFYKGLSQEHLKIDLREITGSDEITPPKDCSIAYEIDINTLIKDSLAYSLTYLDVCNIFKKFNVEFNKVLFVSSVKDITSNKTTNRFRLIRAEEAMNLEDSVNPYSNESSIIKDDVVFVDEETDNQEAV